MVSRAFWSPARGMWATAIGATAIDAAPRAQQQRRDVSRLERHDDPPNGQRLWARLQV